jgi:SNF2 family DNA or RNA helicase
MGDQLEFDFLRKCSVTDPDAQGLYDISSPYNEKFVGVLKSIPGLSWNPNRWIWQGYQDAVCLLGEKVDLRWVLSSRKDTGYRSYPTEGGVSPRGYQEEAASFLIGFGKEGCILADSMGLGKTCSALTAARFLRKKTLIVAPSYVRSVWFNDHNGGELAKWWPEWAERGVYRAQGVTPDTITSLYDLVIIHYDILHAWADALKEWGPEVGILDECHYLMSGESRRSKAVKDVFKGITYRWGLSGTPLTNRPKDLWNVVDTLSPGRFGTFFQYAKRYCDAHKEEVVKDKIVWKFDGKSHQEELASRLKHFVLRRTAKDVALELPPKTRQVLWVDLPGKDIKTQAVIKKSDIRARLNSAADLKIPQGVDIVKSLLKDGHKVVCFTHRREVAEFVMKECLLEGYPAGVVHGGIAPMNRGKEIQNGKDAAGCHLLAATIDSCGTGIDLNYADVGVFLELTWEPHELLQAEARLHRFGQSSPVLIQYVLAKNTVDELIASSVVDKLAVFDSVIGPSGESVADDLKAKEEDIMKELYQSLGLS